VLVIIGTAYAVITSGNASADPQATPNSAQIAHGRNVFLQECATCHGLFAEGTSQAPPSFQEATDFRGHQWR